MWDYSPPNREKCYFLYKFSPKGQFWGSTEKVKYRCTTTNLPLCNDAIIVLKVTLLHIVAISVSKHCKFQSVTNRQANKKYHTFSSTAGARPTIPTILGMVIEEVRTIFSPSPWLFLIWSVVSPLGGLLKIWGKMPPPWKSAYNLVVCPPKATKLKI